MHCTSRDIYIQWSACIYWWSVRNVILIYTNVTRPWEYIIFHIIIILIITANHRKHMDITSQVNMHASLTLGYKLENTNTCLLGNINTQSMHFIWLRSITFLEPLFCVLLFKVDCLAAILDIMLDAAFVDWYLIIIPGLKK